MKTLKYILLTIVLCLLGACTKESLVPSDSEGDFRENETAVISISSKDMLPINMNSRAGEYGTLDEILSKIEDLNIRITKKDNTSASFFINKTTKKKKGTITFNYINGHDFNNLTTNKDVQLHLEGIKASEIQKVEVIANYGSNQSETKDWSTLKDEGADVLTPADKNEDKTCMMYGISTAPANESIHQVNGSPCKLFNVQLKRTRAIITVVMDGTSLHPGVEITPTMIRLCNVPNACTLTNLAPNKGNKITSKSNSIGIAQEAQAVQGTMSQGMVLGAHIDNNGNLPLKFFPLYMFENMQGSNTNSGGKDATKYPKGITNVTEAKDHSKNYPYSFVEIDAEYVYRDNQKSTETVKVGGTITYRFFLGKNSTDNFDIEGNHYYKLTLKLKGFGGAAEDGKVENGKLVVNESDLSWRVDMQTTEWGFKKSQYDFDSHMINGSVDVIGSNWKFNSVKAGDSSTSWLLLNIIKPTSGNLAGQEWVNPTDIVNHKGIKLNIINGKLRFFIQPMVYIYIKNPSLDPEGYFNENTYKQNINYREMVIEVENTDPNWPADKTRTQTITVRQYAPVTVYYDSNNDGRIDEAKDDFFFMERFEEYEDEKGNLIDGFPWGFQNDKLNTLNRPDLGLSGSQKYYFSNSTSSEKNQVGLNSYMLHNTKADYAKGNYASSACFLKGSSGEIQGAGVEYYALPSKKMLEAIFLKSKEFPNKQWGPFEPMHIFENYWTSTVDESSPTESYYYEGSHKQYKSTDSNITRDTRMRIRAIYAPRKY